jgi:putative transposase
MCELARVSRASYYRWLQLGEEGLAEEMRLPSAIQEGSLRYRCYGYRLITALLRQQDWIVNIKRVRRLMSKDGLLAIRRREFIATTDSGHGMPIYPNLAASLELSAVYQCRVADLTFIRLGEQLTSELALNALDLAIHKRSPRPGLVHHSDRGTQYASHAYTERLESRVALASMRRPGRPWKNGKCESFMKTIKKEEVDARSYRNRKELERNSEEFIEENYNKVWLHSSDELVPHSVELLFQRGRFKKWPADARHRSLQQSWNERRILR